MGIDAVAEPPRAPAADAGFDRIAGCLQYSMLVVTTVAEGERAGCLLGFHTQCSIEPVQYAVWLSKANRTFRIASVAEVFALHYLDGNEMTTAELFGTKTGDDVDKFQLCPWHPGPGGVPLLDRRTHRVVGVPVARHDDGGDHVCVVLSPIATDISADGFTPLMFSEVRNLRAGHDSSEW